MIRVMLFILIAVVSGSVMAGDPLPDFGVMLNDDGDLSFTSMDPKESVRNLKAQIDSLAGTSVRTLMWSVGAGSEILYYPTKVANVWGWRPVPEKYEQDFGSWTRKVQAGMAAGVDPVRIAGERARSHGIRFVPSYRMNDDHFIFDPQNYPLTGKFWLDNQKTMTIGESPQPADPHYGNLLDFSHQAVRQFRLKVIDEVITRYEDILDGIELDFNRFQMIFPKDRGYERGHLVTEMLSTVRKSLDQAEARQGRKLHLFVRVPPSLGDCHRMGYRIADWMRPRIVDVILPSQLMTLAHDMPIEEFVRVCAPAGVQVYPSLYPRTGYTWPFHRDPKQEDYEGRPSRRISPSLWRGALANYRQKKASGVQLYNFNLPADDWTHEILRDSGASHSLAHAPRADAIFVVTPGYYLDHTNTYQYRKQIPSAITSGSPAVFTLYVGENYGGAAAKHAVDHCAVRLGFTGELPGDDWELELQINGMILHRGSAGPKLTQTNGVLTYFQTEIHDMAAVYHGKNTLRILINGISNISLEEVQVGVFHREHDFSL